MKLADIIFFLKNSYCFQPVSLVSVSNICLFLFLKGFGVFFVVITIICGAIALLKVKNYFESIIVILCIVMWAWLLMGFSFMKIEKGESLRVNSIEGIVKEIDGYGKPLLIGSTINGAKTDKKVFVDLSKCNISLNEIDSLSTFRVESPTLYRYRDGVVAKDFNCSKIHIDTNIFSSTGRGLSGVLDEIFGANLNENAGLVQAMIFGIDDGLADEDENKFRYLGISHVLVASGANILIIINMIKWVFNTMLSFKNSKFVGLLFIGLYLCVIGFEASITRALFFFIISMIVEMVGRDIKILQKIQLTIIVMLALVPELVFTLGFILSVLATLSLALAEDTIHFFNIHNFFLSEFLSNIVIVSVVNVFLAYKFHIFNANGIIANIAVLWLVNFIVKYGFIFSVLFIPLYLISESLVGYLGSFFALPLMFSIDFLKVLLDIIDEIIGRIIVFRYHPDFVQITIIYVIIMITWLLLQYKRYKDVRAYEIT